MICRRVSKESFVYCVIVHMRTTMKAMKTTAAAAAATMLTDHQNVYKIALVVCINYICDKQLHIFGYFKHKLAHRHTSIWRQNKTEIYSFLLKMYLLRFNNNNTAVLLLLRLLYVYFNFDFSVFNFSAVLH